MKSYPKQNLSLQNMPDEVWKPIKGTNKNYYISNMGRVKSLLFTHERILVQDKNSMGYPLCTITLKNGNPYRFLVHRMVYFTFVRYTKKVVHHKDENRSNPRLSNLEIKTVKEHIQYHVCGTHPEHHIREVEVFNKQGKLLSYHPSVADCARTYNKSPATINKYLTKQFTHRKGYTFSYC